ncbi:unnamed protein product [Sphagnum jensenii]|uniref:Uncharacterized protein n=1 Tax=Sphagnum jensenii TaxID=128206 RepID=A0ABP1BMY5_9BRYO
MSSLCRRQMQVPPVAFSSRRHFYGHSWSSQRSYYGGCSTLSTHGLSRLPRTSHATNFWRKNGGIGLGVVVASDGAASSSQLIAPIAVERLRTPRLMRVRALPSKASSTAQEPPDRKETQKLWEEWLSVATSLYPVYVLVGGLLAYFRPSTFTWFVERGPTSYSAALCIIMLAMGFTLRIQDLFDVFLNRPLAVLFGSAAQYGIMPFVGAGVSKALGLSPELSAGVILLSCCPGGTASNVVTYIAKGDVALSILMTMCTTFAAVFATPLLTNILAGAYVPVDAAGLAISTFQVVLAPVLVGACIQSSCPQIIAFITPFAPLIAVLVSSLLASSVFSANVPLLSLASLEEVTARVSSSGVFVSSHIAAALPTGPGSGAQSALILLGNIGGAVFLVHAAGFLLGYIASMLAGFGESQRRAISIEVGMQNSSLAVVLATIHFASPLTAVPAAVSAVLMNIMGSGLAVVWRQIRIPTSLQ